MFCFNKKLYALKLIVIIRKIWKTQFLILQLALSASVTALCPTSSHTLQKYEPLELETCIHQNTIFGELEQNWLPTLAQAVSPALSRI